MRYPLNTGPFSRHGPQDAISKNTRAVKWVNRALMWMYGFNHEEALRCLDVALTKDPECVFALLLVCYCHGPNYNLSQENVYFELSAAQDSAFPSQKAAKLALDRVKALKEKFTPFESDLFDALELRTLCNNQFANLTIETFAKAMMLVFMRYPQDPDVACFTVEALMQIAPWRHFDANGKAGPVVATIVDVLNRGLAIYPAHPGLNHFKVHLYEMSKEPQAALQAANWLRNEHYDCGHLLHMPSHIDVQLGEYTNSIDTNVQAMHANRRFLKYYRQRGFKAPMYMDYIAHDLHMIVYSALLAGVYTAAKQYAEELYTVTSAHITEYPQRAADLDLFCAIRYHVQIRFGKWDEIIEDNLPYDTELYIATITTRHYAKALAYGVKGEMELAREQESHFNAKRALPKCEARILHNNKAKRMFAVSAKMIEGELAYRESKFEVAFEALAESVKLEESLAYDEPPGQMQPIRHALGGLLLEQKRYEPAKEVFEADLALHPKNPWALRGLVESLQKLNAPRERVTFYSGELTSALKLADIPIMYSCSCVGYPMKECCSKEQTIA